MRPSKSAVARPRLVGRRMVAPVVALALAGVVGPGFTTPASAAVTSIGDLQSALTTCTDPTAITLTQGLTDTTAALEVACTTTIDLAGHDLTVRNVVVATGKTLTVTDSTPVDGGTLTADATSAPSSTAGVQTTGAALVTSGTARLIATGGQYSAGIGGGGFYAAGGTTTSNDSSTIIATGTDDGAGIGGAIFGPGGTTTSNGSSSIVATADVVGAGIGGGAYGAGGTTTSNGSSSITATGGPDDGSDPDDPYGAGAGIGSGAKGTGAGTTTVNGGSTIAATGGGVGASAVGIGQYSVATAGTFLAVAGGTLRLPGGSTLHVPAIGSGSRVAIGAGGLITGTAGASPTYGTITGAGRVTNAGAVVLPTANITATNIADHHYLVDFDTEGGSTAPGTVNVYADTFTHGDRPFPADPTTTGSVFSHWNTRADGTGAVVRADTHLPGSSTDGSARALTLYARYGVATDAVSNLQSTLATCAGPTVVTLTQDLADATAALNVTCDTTIDLAGYDLTVRNAVVATGKTLTVTDSTPADGGTLTADATSAPSPAAGVQTTDAALVTSGTAHLIATGGQYSAGIGGGGFYAAGGSTTSGDTSTIIATGSESAAGIGGAVFGMGGTTTSNDSSSITAVGGSFAAAIGGGAFSAGGTTTSNDSSSITATADVVGAGIGGGYSGGGGTTTSNDASSITATGGPDDGSDPDNPYGGGAGIGGGPGGAGAGTTTVDGGSTITATGGSGASAIGPGQYGSAAAGAFLDVADGTLRLPGGSTLIVPASGSLPGVTVGADGLITGAGTVAGAGEVGNGGAITLPTTDVTVAEVTDRHYTVSFDTAGGSTAPDPVTVFADTFAHGDRVLPSDPTRAGYTFDGWYPQTGGAGTRITAASTLPGTSTDGTPVAITAHASWTSLTPPNPPSPTAIEVPTPVISPAAPVVGDVLTATVGATTPPGATLSYQWSRTSTDGTTTVITDADQPTYTAAAADVGTRISVTVTATPTVTMSGYETGRSTSEPTGAVQAAPTTEDGTIPDPALAVAGQARVGNALTATITRPDIDGLTLTWQWQRIATTGAVADIAGATAPTYTVKPGQLGQQLRLVLTLAAPGHTTLVVHDDTGPVQAGHLRRPVGRVTGTPAPGHRLVVTVRPLAQRPAGYMLSYQWNRNGHALAHKADRRAYRPRPHQVGSRLTVTVTVSAPGYASTTWVSRPRLVHAPRR